MTFALFLHKKTRPYGRATAALLPYGEQLGVRPFNRISRD